MCACTVGVLKPYLTSLLRSSELPPGAALNGCEMLMLLIREAKGRGRRGLNKEGRPAGVKKRVKAKISQPKERERVQINYRFMRLSKLEKSSFFKNLMPISCYWKHVFQPPRLLWHGLPSL